MGKNAIHERASVVLLLVDVINDFRFPDGEKILRQALPTAMRLAKLKNKARRARVPVIYVNDNFGQWRSDATKVLNYCLRTSGAGREFVAAIRPDEHDYCVLKPMHSAFYQTPLEILLREFGASTLVLAGLTTNSCILCTAHDAKMRNFKTIVAADCCAARTSEEHKKALDNMREMADARIVTSKTFRFSRDKRANGKRG